MDRPQAATSAAVEALRVPEPSLVPDQYSAPRVAPLVRAAVTLGVGLGAVLDAAIFHHVLRWHHLVDRRTSDLAANLTADGLFLLAATVVLLAGVALLWRASARVQWPAGGRALGAGIVLGAAAFNVAEVLVDHFLLGLHWLHPSGDPMWDVGFVLVNALVGAAAWRWLQKDGLVRLARAERAHRRRTGGAG